MVPARFPSQYSAYWWIMGALLLFFLGATVVFLLVQPTKPFANLASIEAQLMMDSLAARIRMNEAAARKLYYVTENVDCEEKDGQQRFRADLYSLFCNPRRQALLPTLAWQLSCNDSIQADQIPCSEGSRFLIKFSWHNDPWTTNNKVNEMATKFIF